MLFVFYLRLFTFLLLFNWLFWVYRCCHSIQNPPLCATWERSGRPEDPSVTRGSGGNAATDLQRMTMSGAVSWPWNSFHKLQQDSITAGLGHVACYFPGNTQKEKWLLFERLVLSNLKSFPSHHIFNLKSFPNLNVLNQALLQPFCQCSKK